MIKKLITVIAIVIAGNVLTYSQSAVNSPYTRFGIGEIDRNGFNNSRAMGGLTTGLRQNNQINYLNPAALSSQDTMSFIFDIGASGTYNSLKNSSNSLEYKNFTFDHLAFTFPVLKKWWYAGVGITPYSKIGYNIMESSPHPYLKDTLVYNKSLGEGGINQFFVSSSFRIHKNISIGFNYNFFFGNINQYNEAFIEDPNSYATVINDKHVLRSSAFDAGIQYHTDINEKYFLVVGLSYSSNVKFNSKNTIGTFTTNNFNTKNRNVLDFFGGIMLSSNIGRMDYIDTISLNEQRKTIEIPAKYSIGFSTGIKDKLIIGFDYSQQDWSNAKTFNSDKNYTLDQKFNLGVEYTPNKDALRNYFKVISYRAGLYFNKNYLKLNNKQINSYGISVGIGMPIIANTKLNISYTYGKKGTTDNRLIQETYSLIGVNLTFYDIWFFKRKFQ
ncbi:MAG: outer membrane protein transport protein [Bacteroidales bacterium]|nr:outer membrane protein transport protein [Bacteroidales bacterium]